MFRIWVIRKTLKTKQSALDVITIKLQFLQLSLSIRKTKRLAYSNKRKKFTTALLHINGSNIPYVEISNVLGFTLHKQLFHIDRVFKQFFQLIEVLKCICGVFWGSDPLCIIKLYTALMTTKLENACSLLLGASEIEVFRVRRVQWKCLCLDLGTKISTHTLRLEQIIPFKCQCCH